MKVSIAVCVVIFVVGAHCDPVTKPSGLQYIKECADEENVDINLLADINDEKTFLINRRTMCFAHCVMHRNGMMDDEGKMTDTFLNILHADDCQMTGHDNCETAALSMDCLLNKGSAVEEDLIEFK